MENNTFKFELGSKVELTESDESGRVIGQARYEDDADRYLIRYRAGDGRQVEDWWTGSALRAA